MGNWSINPNILASIDDNGKVTFQEHTQDTNYTITYNDGTSGNITKTFTVYACSQPPVDCSVYEFSTITRPVEGHTTTSIAYSLRSLEQLTYTIMSSGGFLTGITVVGTSDRWQYMGEFNTTTSSSDRTATIEYKNGDGTCVFTQQLVMKGETDCSVYEFSTRTTPVETHATTPIAWSIDSLEQLTYTIKNNGGFLTSITIVHTSDRWQYMGVFNTTTSTSDRTATIEYKNGDGTCTFTQQLVMKGETDCPQYNITQDVQITCDGGIVHFTATKVTCYCSALTLSDTSVSVNAGASTSVTYSADCVSITSIAASSTGITIDTGTTSTINITGNTKGTYTITIKSSAAGSTCPDKMITVNVNCGTITINPKDSSGDCSGGTVNFSATYTP